VSFYIDQFFGYVITMSRYLLPHRIQFCKISGIVKLLKVGRTSFPPVCVVNGPMQTVGKEVLPTHNTQITGIHAENRTTLPLINNYTVEGSIICYLILL
jgi:hypothetical protein